MPRALLLTGDAAEELGTMYPYYRVQDVPRRAGASGVRAAEASKDRALPAHHR